MPFKETQTFAPWVLWLLRGTIVFAIFMMVFAFRHVDVPSPVLYFIIFIVVISLLPCFLLEFIKLKTEIDITGIKMNFAPFSKKSYSWAEIETAELIDYGFIGGWGVRKTAKYGTVYNTQGREGLWLTLKSGKQVIIGTQQKDELQKALDKYLSV